MDQRYIQDWLKANYKRVNELWDKPPRLLGKTGIYSAEQHEFFRLGELLVARLEKVIARDNPRAEKPIQFAIVNSPELGAWAFWASRCYGILITQGLIKNMQSVCGQADRLMAGAMATPQGEDNFLRGLWSEMPGGNSDFSSFGSLLAQIAFDFIVHHELAHAGLGHEWVMATARASGDILTSSDEERIWVLNEFSAIASASGDRSSSSWSQALEADADNQRADELGLVFDSDPRYDQPSATRPVPGQTTAVDAVASNPDSTSI